jgi:hypothetical protein
MKFLKASGEAMSAREFDRISMPEMTGEAETEQTPPWEMLEAGRYRPRRIRGSCRGRELG